MGDSLLDQPRVSGREIFYFPVSGIPPDFLLKSAPEGRRAAVVDREESKSVIEPCLTPNREALGEGHLGSTMDGKNCREGTIAP